MKMGNYGLAFQYARRPLWWLTLLVAMFAASLVVARYAHAYQGSGFDTPSPNLSLQKCTVEMSGDLLTIVCDSSKVCPPGWHLHTQLRDGLNNRTVGLLIGYGDKSEATNSCEWNSGHTGWAENGSYQRHVEVRR